MSVLGGLLIIVAFVAWFVYHAVIKRDLKSHINDFYAGLAMVTLWGLIYLLLSLV